MAVVTLDDLPWIKGVCECMFAILRSRWSATTSTMAMHVYRSNRTEALLERLSKVLEGPVPDPMVAELVVVQGRGMAVWLSQQLCLRHGVWSNAAFLYPRNFIQQMLDTLLGPPARRSFGKHQLLWSVLVALERHIDQPELARLAAYVDQSSDIHGLRRFQLARNIADTFDQYVTYRPEMIAAWERGHDGELGSEHAWQPLLWRSIVERGGAEHIADRARRCVEALLRDDFEPTGLPRRICVFGLSTLPPLYARVLVALARHVSVHVFLPTPTRHSWTDLCRAHEIRRILRTHRDGAADLDALHLDTGNPLVASLAGVAADFHAVLDAELEALGVPATEPDDGLFVTPDSPDMLATLQADVLELCQRGAGPGETPPVPMDPTDASVQVLSCHSPMREVEVLHDHLLAALDRADGPRPEDIVVMTPDVETYAPLIEAVFERESANRRRIPYRIADRSIRADAPVIEALHAMLGLVGSRVPASSVLDLLHIDAIARHFGLSPDDVETITQWVVEVGIRWGIDAADRERHGQPAVDQNTWQFGLDRLLIGYAMPARGRELFCGTLPHDEIEGQDAELVGKLVDLCHRLFTRLRGLERPRTLPRWRDAIAELLDTMTTSTGPAGWQHQKVRDAIGALAEEAAEAGFDGDVHLRALVPLLDPKIDDAHPARGFLGSGVTVCAMLPMRSVPFRMVCMLGMGDRSFPRSSRPVDFDLIAARPRRGDRSRRGEDRHLFLEALLAARERLVITYVGQNVRDNSEIPPSVVVSELLDVISDGFVSSPTDDRTPGVVPVIDRVRVRHPLQPFSRRYFDGQDERLFSHARHYLDGAASLLRPPRKPPPFFAHRLDVAEQASSDRRVALRELGRFLAGPARYLLQRRLGLYLRDDTGEVPDREPLELAPLERYAIGNRLLDVGLSGIDPAAALPLVRASGSLPLGTLGERAHAAQAHAVRPILEWIEAKRGTGQLDGLVVNRDLDDGTRLTGQLTHRYGCGLVRWQFGRVATKHLVSLWVRHLALCWLTPGDGATESWIVGPDKSKGRAASVFRPVAEPGRLLTDLVSLYQLGQREPLLLFPEPSRAYWARFSKTEDHAEALGAADRAWSADRFPDLHAVRVFGQPDHVPREIPGFGQASEEFASLSRRVFEPLLEHLDEDDA